MKTSILPYGYKLDMSSDDTGYLDGPEKRTPWICFHKIGDHWNIQSNSDARIPDSVRRIAFPTPEHAAAVGLTICLEHDKQMKEFAAPKDLISAIDLAEREVDAMERAARDMAFSVALAKRSIDSLRAAAGLPVNEWRKDDLVEAINSFTLYSAAKQKHSKHPFFTEAVLYDMLGKDDARSVLGLIAQVKRRLDPVGGAL